jgi:soluble lytic murein transglycosylase-like protein
LLVLFASVSGAGWWAYRAPTLRAAARDYLAPRIVLRHEDVIRSAAEESGVDPNLLAAIMFAESSGRPGAVSSKGALGLFQLSVVTAKWRAEELGLPEPTREQLLSDTLLNARLGADNMAWLLDTYGDDELRAACAYNAGYGLLRRLTDAAGGWRAWREQGEASGRSEILAYGKKVLHYRDEFRRRGLFEPE